MPYVHLVAVLALVQFLFFGYRVGQARRAHGVLAPATTGEARFERAYRAQMNTLEQLAVFLPALLLSAVYWPQAVVASIGVAYLAGRALYWRAYLRDPETRNLAFGLTLLANAALVGLLLAGAGWRAVG